MKAWNSDGADLEPSPKPAPGQLRLVQSFVNSLDIEAQRDEWSTLEGLERWCGTRHLLGRGKHLGEDNRRTMIIVRESLRALLRARNGGPPSNEAAAALNEVALHAGVRARFDGDGTASFRAENRTMATNIGVVLSITLQAMADQTWSRLRVCRNDECLWCFYDGSKNGSGRWCEAELCGNMLRARSYRARVRARASRAP